MSSPVFGWIGVTAVTAVTAWAVLIFCLFVWPLARSG